MSRFLHKNQTVNPDIRVSFFEPVRNGITTYCPVVINRVHYTPEMWRRLILEMYGGK